MTNVNCYQHLETCSEICVIPVKLHGKILSPHRVLGQIKQHQIQKPLKTTSHKNAFTCTDIFRTTKKNNIKTVCICLMQVSLVEF